MHIPRQTYGIKNAGAGPKNPSKISPGWLFGLAYDQHSACWSGRGGSSWSLYGLLQMPLPSSSSPFPPHPAHTPVQSYWNSTFIVDEAALGEHFIAHSTSSVSLLNTGKFISRPYFLSYYWGSGHRRFPGRFLQQPPWPLCLQSCPCSLISNQQPESFFTNTDVISPLSGKHISKELLQKCRPLGPTSDSLTQSLGAGSQKPVFS